MGLVERVLYWAGLVPRSDEVRGKPADEVIEGQQLSERREVEKIEQVVSDIKESGENGGSRPLSLDALMEAMRSQDREEEGDKGDG